MAVIKANAYGHGLVHAAKALADADGFAVARLDEGLALRAAGLTNRVLLLEGVFNAEQLALAAREHFELMVHSFEQLELLDGLQGSAGITAWIKIDSGMNRLGFRLDEFGAAYERLRHNPHVQSDPTLVDAPCFGGRPPRPEDQAATRRIRDGNRRLARGPQHCKFRRCAWLACRACRLGASGVDAIRGVAVSEWHRQLTRAASSDDVADRGHCR